MAARDYGQSEFRIMAWLAQEKILIKALYDGEDPHRLTASKILNKKPDQITKGERQLAKGINFGLLYGAQAFTLKEYMENNYGVTVSLEEAEQFREKFFEVYPNIRRFHIKCENIIRKYGYIRSPLGRIRRLPGIKSDDFGEQNRAIRQGINFVIQSFSSDLALIGLYIFYSKFKRYKTVQPLFFIHDSNMFMAHRNTLPSAMLFLKIAMEELAPAYVKKYFGVKVGYPVITDGKVGYNWAHMKEIEDEMFHKWKNSKEVNEIDTILNN